MKKTYKNLKKKGFNDAPGDHLFLEFYYNGKFILHTKISHGSHKDIGTPLIKLMANQCKLTKVQFEDFASCTLSEKEYIKILIDNGEI